MQLVDIGVNLTSGQFRRFGSASSGSRRCGDDGDHRHECPGESSSVAIGCKTQGLGWGGALCDRRSRRDAAAIINGNDGALVVAVGECGLDFNRDCSPKDAQIRAFRAQVALAYELQMRYSCMKERLTRRWWGAEPIR
ncbi:hypothetical protein PHYBOEH_007224 [Phytophthora boehmeriae]|uniref:Uncharacterized protein n=1 Tax=Phytophthora boehmeriae TaxID=109152 RepID=A0A8T1WC32_9STRA|nr:hypothetical protein PHYBOEH_007224 [Phytophthora boehmeriae]